MKNSIIVIPEINENINLAASIKKAQTEIVNYFGTKSAEADEYIPMVKITCDITQEDLDILNKKIDLSCITLIAILAEENSDKVNGDIIDLR